MADARARAGAPDADVRPSSPPPSRRSPPPSATRPGASIYLFARDHDGDATASPRRRGRRAVRAAPQRRPPPPRQARRRRLPRGRRRARRRAPAPGRPSKRYRAVAERVDARRAGAQRRPRRSRCSAGRSTVLPRDEAEAMAEEVGAEYGRAMAAGLTGDALRRRPALAALGAARRRRRAHRPRLRRPHADGSRHADRAAHRQRPLPVRRRRHRAPGDLRRRPRHGARACSARSTATTTTSTSPPSQQGPRRHDLRHRGLTTALRRPHRLDDCAVTHAVALAQARRTRSIGSITWSPALCDGAGVERRLRVVLDHQLHGLGRRAVDEQLDETQRHVDAARHAGGGDDPLVEVLDDPLARSAMAPSLREDVHGAPSASSPSARRAARPRRARASRCTPTSCTSSSRGRCAPSRAPARRRRARGCRRRRGTRRCRAPASPRTWRRPGCRGCRCRSDDLAALVADERDVVARGSAAAPRTGRCRRGR